jgi:hypothetical protein
MALAGNLKAIEYLMDRLEGRPTVKVDAEAETPMLIVPAPPVSRPKLNGDAT